MYLSSRNSHTEMAFNFTIRWKPTCHSQSGHAVFCLLSLVTCTRLGDPVHAEVECADDFKVL